MSLIQVFSQRSWTIPGDIGSNKYSDDLFKELSPPRPFTILQVWISWKGVITGDGTSKLQIDGNIFQVLDAAKLTNQLYWYEVGIAAAATTRPFDFVTGASPSDGNKLLRCGNFNIQDGRFMKIYGEQFELSILNSGTAYTAGSVFAKVEGWTE